MPHYSTPTWSVLLIALVALSGCQGRDESQASTEAEPAPLVSVVHAKVGQLVSSITVTGTLVPHRVALVQAQTPGLVVTELLAEEGQTVAAGQLLARLSSERQRAELTGARGELRRAEQALARAEVLKANGTVARSSADSAMASHAEALARVRALEIDLARAEVRAPIGGFLQRRQIEIGEVANEKPLFEIAGDSAMELVVDLSEAAWREARVGQHADITLVGGQVLTGEITRLSGALDSQTRLRKAWIGLKNPPADLIAGAGASVRLQIGKADLLILPRSSLLFDQDGAYVFIVLDGKAVRRAITLGAQNAEASEISKGLDVGDTVVARAGSLLRDGDPVWAAATEHPAKDGTQ